MNDMLRVLNNRHVELFEERKGVIDKLFPLESQKKMLDEKIKAIEHLISLEGESGILIDEPNKKTEIDEKQIENVDTLAGKTGQEAYRELIETNFKNRPFKEQEIRNLANEKGLLINNKTISGSYSRGLLGRLIDQGDLKRIGKGVFGVGDFKLQAYNLD